jgi:hypothetical protein
MEEQASRLGRGGREAPVVFLIIFVKVLIKN